MTEIKTAYVFPGQGAQFVGMGRDLYSEFHSARELFDLADKALGFSLSKLCFEGPEEDLKDTRHSQSAIVCHSLSALSAFIESGKSKLLPEPSFVAGHSLGEYSALGASGILTYVQAILLARKRGELMAEAAAKTPGAMAAVIGISQEILSDICLKTGCYIANFNSPGQLVISGLKEAVDQASAQATASGAMKVVTLQVSGGFHTPLMSPASTGLKEMLNSMDFKTARIPLVANTSACPVSTPQDVKAELYCQLTGGVQWQKSIENMIASGVNTFVEIGPGKVLAGLIKRINRSVSIYNINDAASIQNFSV
ncbi:malonyl CoA-acyl carrier protein transacylase [Dehalococcoides mccartyi]|jgi:[acyl-carrier-protein] S-malonyltransferase|uniref:Malonyl CoA-acyl carrier protein transacylase n=1 Tax=Dehalococcoides mccartyi TaxID=61435 RepID=A0A328EKK3_9CHLR|nr:MULTISPECIES: ACP S-malonyltransferase [Dehalococcoides]AGG06735.1 malonyl CoA-acyl carrier protein transacylase [Dehalococcoides mccartyi DCMB5]AQX74947.1 malonyl CoA-acyl carrier protein transacylase [Dehalococcoides mccartyi]AQY73523.1 malonyl CoA-acyl carrier protein transacylase [Dehalococcoides mccartyi]RAL69152.1 Malonyl CoA-acyl carrier protein transacylase [Dehalococcoides mccartyi]BAS32145.1 malonyl CoA-acyl carrier protein transacylase [Dehalococcoides mccartyi IBARAKI]